MGVIVVGYDDTAGARRALAHAAERARAGGDRLLVVAVVEVPLTPEASPTGEFLDGAPIAIEPVEPAEVEDALARAADALDGYGVDAEFFWTSGDPAGELVRIANEKGARAIVVGADAEGAAGLFGEAVAAEVEREAACEVVVVPRG